jgi:fatty acid desaturase
MRHPASSSAEFLLSASPRSSELVLTEHHPHAGSRGGDGITRLLPLVEWKDLLRLPRPRILYEATLPVPYLFLSLYLANLGFTRHWLWLVVAIGASFFVFLTALRVVHNAYHYALGLPRWLTELWMFLHTVLLLSWMHGVQITHLLHHRHCLREDDVESRSARMPWWGSILTGPCFPFWLLKRAWRVAKPYQRRWIALEVAYNALVVPLIFVPAVPAVLRYHLLAMVVGECMFPFFGVWSVHHDVHVTRTIARTLRHALGNRISFGMFYHLEHHLFPRVPTCRLPALAERIDQNIDPDELERVF